MRGVQHPVGPEPEGVYWRRRAVLVIVVVLVLVLAIWLVGQALGGRGRSAAPVVKATPSATSINPSWTDTVWDTSTPSVSSPTASAPTPSASRSPETSTPTGSPSGTPSHRASGSASGSASASRSPSPTPTPTPVLAACRLSQLRSAIAAPSSVVRRGTTVALTVTVTNQGTAGCVWDIAKLPVQVNVDSGSDRIWSTADCAAWGPTGAHPIAAGKSWKFTVKWPTKRSATGTCKLSAEELGTGTYVATAQLKGGMPRQFVMQLTA